MKSVVNSGYVYVCGAIFNIVQYVLYALSAIYVLVTVATVCVRGMHKIMIHLCWSAQLNGKDRQYSESAHGNGRFVQK